MSTNLRGKIFIDRSVQGALVKRIISHWCIFLALASISLVALETFLGDPNSTFAARLSAVWGKYAFFFLLMFAILPPFIYDTIKLSHRFAGPISRLKSSLRSMANGEEVSQIKFRESDFWAEIASDFNRVADQVHDLRANQRPQEEIDETAKINVDDTVQEPVGCTS